MTTPPEETQGKFRKKPVVIEARLWDGSDRHGMSYWCADAGFYQDVVIIDTLEGKMNGQPGDWIIKGIKGEFYPCKPDIFAATYEPAALSLSGEKVGMRQGQPAEVDGWRTPLRCTLACMDDMADWIERTKPQGVLYSACLPALREGARAIRESERYAALGRACERHALGWYEGGEMLFQAPADVIAEQAVANYLASIPSGDEDDINWKAEWEATSSLRRADARVIDRLKEGLGQIAHSRNREGDLAAITLAAVETGNG